MIDFVTGPSWPQLTKFLVAHSYLFAMLLLIGLGLYLHPGCFCSAYHYPLLEVYWQAAGHDLYLLSIHYCKLKFEASF